MVKQWVINHIIHGEYDLELELFKFPLDKNIHLFISDPKIESQVRTDDNIKTYENFYLESDVDLPITFLVRNKIHGMIMVDNIVSFSIDFIEASNGYHDLIDQLVEKNKIIDFYVEHGRLKFPIDRNIHLFDSPDQNSYYSDGVVAYIYMDSNYPVDFFIDNEIRVTRIEKGEVSIRLDKLPKNRPMFSHTK